MYVLATYKDEEDQIKNKVCMVKILYIYILDAQGQLLHGGKWPKFTPTEAAMLLHWYLQEWGRSNCKNREVNFNISPIVSL